ncbi:MAG: 3-ketoacyl-CoA thiolase [Novosphingobium sp.]|nr:3-ketoacyl-CoA thiolase [Novosphingobium sp.]
MALKKVGVIATAQTELRPAWSDAQHIDLISSVVTSVFKGSGLTIDDVDFVIDSGSDVLDGRSISNCGFLGALGAHHKEEARVEEDGIWAAHYGVNKIASGAASVGLIVAYSKPSESQVANYWSSQVEPFYQRPVGFSQRAAGGIQAQRYLAANDVSMEDLANLVAARWAAAQENGGVQIDKLPSASDVLSAAEGAAPLTDLMFSRPMDGAVAVLLADEATARRAGADPVLITGMGSSADAHAFADRDNSRLNSLSLAAERAAASAGWSAAEADIVEVSASTAVAELMALEALGLAKPGQGKAAAQGGKVAVNNSGGALPADPLMVTGLARLVEAVRQLRQPKRYGLSSASRAVVHGANGIGMQSNCVFNLEV